MKEKWPLGLVWVSVVAIGTIGIVIGYLTAGYEGRWWYYVIAGILVVLIISGLVWVLWRQRKRWRIEAAEALQDENVVVSLVGRHSKTIMVFFLTLAVLMVADSLIFLLIPASPGGRDFMWGMSFWPLLGAFGFGLVLWDFSKSFKVQVSSGKLYLRGMSPDVSRKIKAVERMNNDRVTIRFNFLYQLHVKGSQEQLDLFLHHLQMNEVDEQ